MIESIVFFVNKFLYDRKVVLIMHANDLRVLKEIQSFLDSYHMKVQMKWIIINYSAQYNTEDLSSQVGVEDIYFNFLQTQSSLKYFMF